MRAQFEAYNAHDVEAFLACYAEDVVVTDGIGAVLMSGRDAMRSSYTAMFADHGDVHAEILARQHAGAWTVDHERVSRGEAVLDVLVAYRVEAGLIDRALMVR